MPRPQVRPDPAGDYYRLQAFFANTAADDQFRCCRRPTRGVSAEARGLGREDDGRSASRWRHCWKPVREEADGGVLREVPARDSGGVLKPAAERTPFEWQMCAEGQAVLEIADEEQLSALKGDAEDAIRGAEEGAGGIRRRQSGRLRRGIGLRDLSREAPASTSLRRANTTAPKEEVQPGS